MNERIDQGNRTFVGSVCFVDIVGYSKKMVSEQITIKDRFTALLSEALKDVAIDQRIILDTGDGAAISFLGDPEDALFVSMHMRDFLQRALLDADEVTIAHELSLRIGINLGPVKLIRDINGQPNIVGDGINVAQRIMSFAQPAQIVVSRSYYDVLSVISDEYAKLFHYEGSRTDKHVREHEIYIIGESVAAFNQAKAGMVDRAATTSTNLRARQAGVSTDTFAHRKLAGEGSASGFSALLQDRKKIIMLGGVLGVVALALVAVIALKKPAMPAGDSTNKATDATTQSLAPIVKLEPAKTDPLTNSDATIPDSAKTSDSATMPTALTAVPAVATGTGEIVVNKDNRAQQQNIANHAKPADEQKPAKADAAKPDQNKLPTQLPTGNVSFSIQPWGEVFINGKLVGISPPLKRKKLAPGKYKIELKNAALPTSVSNIEVKSNEEITIKHRFQ